MKICLILDEFFSEDMLQVFKDALGMPLENFMWGKVKINGKWYSLNMIEQMATMEKIDLGNGRSKYVWELTIEDLLLYAEEIVGIDPPINLKIDQIYQSELENLVQQGDMNQLNVRIKELLRDNKIKGVIKEIKTKIIKSAIRSELQAIMGDNIKVEDSQKNIIDVLTVDYISQYLAEQILEDGIDIYKNHLIPLLNQYYKTKTKAAEPITPIQFYKLLQKMNTGDLSIISKAIASNEIKFGSRYYVKNENTFYDFEIYTPDKVWEFKTVESDLGLYWQTFQNNFESMLSKMDNYAWPGGKKRPGVCIFDLTINNQENHFENHLSSSPKFDAIKRFLERYYGAGNVDMSISGIEAFRLILEAQLNLNSGYTDHFNFKQQVDVVIWNSLTSNHFD